MVKSKAAQEATRRYEAKHNDIVRVLFPKGTKDRIKLTGDTVNGFIVKAVLSRLEELNISDNKEDQ